MIFMTLRELILKTSPYDISITFSLGMYGHILIRARKNCNVVSRAVALSDLDNDDFMNYVIESLVCELTTKKIEVSEEIKERKNEFTI